VVEAAGSNPVTQRVFKIREVANSAASLILLYSEKADLMLL